MKPAPYPVAVPAFRYRLNKSLSRLVLALLLLGSLAATACSGSESENVVPLDAPAPGLVYVGTSAGDLQVVSPSDASAEIVISTSGEDQDPIVDLGPQSPSLGLTALTSDRASAFTTSAMRVADGAVVPIDSVPDGVSCLDPHAAATSELAHVAASTDVGANFEPIVLGDGAAPSGFDMISVACPRWTAARDAVATAINTRNSDPSSIVTIVQTADGQRHEIGFDQCGTTPTSFSPDDAFLALSLTCYSSSWDNSGLYLVAMTDLEDLDDLSALTKLGEGLFGRSSWHPGGEWIAAVRADPIEEQNIAQNLSAQPRTLQVIEIDTRQTIDLPLAGDDTPFTVVYLDEAIG